MTLALAFVAVGCASAIAMALFRARGRDEAADYLRFLSGLATVVGLSIWLVKG